MHTSVWDDVAVVVGATQAVHIVADLRKAEEKERKVQHSGSRGSASAAGQEARAAQLHHGAAQAFWGPGAAAAVE
jgi:hypothetical protein